MPDAGCNPTLSFPMLWSFVLLGLAVADLILSGLPGAGRPIPCVQTFVLSAVEHCSGNALFVRLRTSLKVLHSLSTFSLSCDTCSCTILEHIPSSSSCGSSSLRSRTLAPESRESRWIVCSTYCVVSGCPFQWLSLHPLYCASWGDLVILSFHEYNLTLNRPCV
ncbi:uncharacterized protein CC84DRAFT_459473 [Paraphaeosphaeria sporulosa]|uniref:Uncharacterized protein n=1 Tax=Paraphaeosphaeria sporulosa TaxID=1460663 RepID=A0A177CS37_9PLEO|nr:uncharacterized protein CC84DRAFT_459473 [Paraphaeosphaeria sporulosa]OAG10011.1 hypothetical protein CC84DRAFT_459473 [Paraphaeosphaeria sporulosa]